ncbi:hypothetical protein K110096F8_24720 [Dielma fastidiosa]
MDHLLSKEKEVEKIFPVQFWKVREAQSRSSSFFENQITEDIRDKNMIFLNRKAKDKSRKNVKQTVTQKKIDPSNWTRKTQR